LPLRHNENIVAGSRLLAVGQQERSDSALCVQAAKSFLQVLAFCNFAMGLSLTSPFVPLVAVYNTMFHFVCAFYQLLECQRSFLSMLNRLLSLFCI